ncbi:SDR family oxidoreductase [Persicobacter psychrovividus]|uniref:Oxidoreductase n=1 Tax=Persicobacter psychrovividus TaxID=387638 RepID=A0ABN6LD31_9BACT|nr:oxidoreductase [Persicobacter psychrovividus]
MKPVALITGASSGIGKALARIHAAQGGDLVIIARSEGKLLELKEELSQKHQIAVKVIVKDLTDANAPQEIYDEVQASGISIDFLINNAGFGGVGKFHQRAWEDDLAMINLNIVALSALTRLFLPDMVKRNAGKILNVSSTASLVPGPLQAVYYATKAYVTSFSNAIAQELHDTKVTVTNLMPGATATGFGEISGMDKTALFDETADADQVALDAYSGMINGKLDVITGLKTSQKIMLKMAPFVPKKLILKQVHSAQKSKE